MQQIAPYTPFISNGTKIERKRLNDQTLQGAVSLDSTALPAPLQHCPMDNAQDTRETRHFKGQI